VSQSPEATTQQSNMRTLANAAVRMRGITKSFGSNRALNAVDFDVLPGEIHALLGENGAGKSTLMHVLTGITAPDAGSIEVGGTPVKVSSPTDSRRVGIAMVHQHFALAPALSVAENLALDHMPARGAGSFLGTLNYRPLEAAQMALESAARLGWKMDPNARVSTLSVGEQQRIEIVKALATNANVLIFDEPTAVLIGDEISELFGVLRMLAAEGKAIILIAHKLAEILAASDRVTVLRRGVKTAEALTKDATAPLLAEWMIGDKHSSPKAAAAQPAHADAEPQRIICRAENLTISGTRGEMPIRGLNMQAVAGKILGIGGVDGNGQTELAEALAGLRPVHSGSLAIDARKTGYIPQDRRHAGLAVTMSVADNLLFDAALSGDYRFGPFIRTSQLRKLSLDLIQKYDIRTPSPDIPASALSGGNQQKIVVARALLGDPEFIVAVNPTRGLDIGAAQFVHAQLINAKLRGAAVVLISTDLDELAAVSDTTAILAGGVLQPFTPGQTSASELGLLMGGLSSSREPER
jgi:general nucleoside transport system ATP-binding protein